MRQKMLDYISHIQVLKGLLYLYALLDPIKSLGSSLMTMR